MSSLPFEKIERRILLRKEAETSDKFGKRPDKRTADELLSFSIINIDKPKGPTSHQVSAYVKQILKLDKSGHSGTLDPKVTGVLPVAVGRGTRIVQALLPAGKEYVALMHLHTPLPEEKIREGLAKFVGKMMQLPPVKSAVKRQVREREVYYIDILEIDGQDVLFKAGTQAGTYIRKLIHDMGIALGTGAHMAELRRTKVGPFDESTLATLQDLTDAVHFYKENGDDALLRKVMQPIENATKHIPKIWIFDTTVNSLCHGANLHVPGICKVETQIHPGEDVAIMTLKNELVCLGTAQMTSLEMTGSRGLAATVDKVFMEIGVYPKIEIVKS